MIRQKAQLAAERINGLSLRERMLLMLASLAVLFLVWDAFIMKPVRDRQAHAQSELELIRERVMQLTNSIQTMAMQASQGPDRLVQEQAAGLESEISELERRLEARFADAVAPGNAVEILSGLLGQHERLTVTRLENLPSQNLQDAAGAAVFGVYIHRIRVSVEGDHAAIRSYLGRVDALPRGIFLESMQLSVPDWPLNRVELMFYSLTLDDSWLGV